MYRLTYLLLVVAGCAANSGDESFIIRQNLAPPEGMCVFTADATALTLGRGQLRLDSTTPYLFTPLFESRVVAATGKESLRTVFLKRAEIALSIGPIETVDAAGAVTEDPAIDTSIKFTSLFAAALPPNGGFATASFDLVRADALSLINQRVGSAAGTRVHAQVLATVTAVGDFYGDEISSAPYQYPVEVCNDCILNNAGTCPLPTGSILRLGNACNSSQDGVIDCCGPMGGPLTCPATVAGM